jgi:hypothetical protein
MLASGLEAQKNVTFQELFMSLLMTQEALTRLLVAKGIITEKTFCMMVRGG